MHWKRSVSLSLRKNKNGEKKRKPANGLLIMLISNVIVLCFYLCVFIFFSKIEMEAKRKAEELERLRQEEADRNAAVALQV